MQRGIAGLFLIIGILVLVSAVVGVAFYLNKLQVQKITDFESCAKAGNPVMESYPAQCNTKDGRHFVQKLSDEEQKRLDDQFKALGSPTPSPSAETANWKTYTNENFKYQIKYPDDWIISESDPENVSFTNRIKKGDKVPGIIAIHVRDKVNFRYEDIPSYAPFDYEVIEKNNKVFLVTSSTYQDGVASSDISEETEQETINIMRKILSTLKYL